MSAQFKPPSIFQVMDAQEVQRALAAHVLKKRGMAYKGKVAIDMLTATSGTRLVQVRIEVRLLDENG